MNNSITVMKFGGTSVDSIDQVIDLVDKESHDSQPIAVVSAFSGNTNELNKISKQILYHPKGLKCKRDLTELIKTSTTSVLAKVEAKFSTLFPTVPAPELEKFTNLYLKPQLSHIIEHAAEPVWGILLNESEITPEQQTFIEDRLISRGEVYAGYLLAELHNHARRSAKPWLPIDLSELFSNNYLAPKNLSKTALIQLMIEKIRFHLRGGIEQFTPILSGHVGYLPGGIIQMIDRGYTDFTAAMTSVAAKDLLISQRKFDIHALPEIVEQHVRLEIWKEVPGLLSIDPRVVEGEDYSKEPFHELNQFKKAQLRTAVSYKEAAEMASLGGMKAINPKGIKVLRHQGIPLSVKNTYEPELPGTNITEQEDLDNPGIRFISAKSDQSVISIEDPDMDEEKGVAAKILQKCSDLGVSVGAITTSETNISLSIDSKHKNKLLLVEQLKSLEGLKDELEVELTDNLAMVCLIGNSMRNQVGILANVFRILANANINILFDCGHPDRNITLIIEQKDLQKALQVLHHDLIEQPLLSNS